METRVIHEEPALVLQGYDFNREGEDVEISFEELRRAEVGQTWRSRAGNSVRDWKEEEAKVVYKDNRGVAVRVTTWYVPDSPSGDAEKSVKLLWFEFFDEMEEE